MEHTDDRNDGDTTGPFQPGSVSTPGPSEQIPIRTTTMNRPPERGLHTAETSFIEGRGNLTREFQLQEAQKKIKYYFPVERYDRASATPSGIFEYIQCIRSEFFNGAIWLKTGIRTLKLLRQPNIRCHLKLYHAIFCPSILAYNVLNLTLITFQFILQRGNNHQIISTADNNCRVPTLHV